jgi:hypothetical protein
MVLGRIQDGHIELSQPLPQSWEGQTVKVEPCTPDDPLPGLSERIAALHALGPMEYAAGEREQILRALQEMDALSRQQMRRLADELL